MKTNKLKKKKLRIKIRIENIIFPHSLNLKSLPETITLKRNTRLKGNRVSSTKQ